MVKHGDTEITSPLALMVLDGFTPTFSTLHHQSSSVMLCEPENPETLVFEATSLSRRRKWEMLGRGGMLKKMEQTL